MRDYRLRERRERLGLSQRQLAEIGATAQIQGCFRFLQGYVSIAETHPQRRPEYVAACRRILVKLEQERRFEARLVRHDREHLACEDERISFQRSLWAALPDHPAVRALKAAMLDRCLDLMNEGRGEETDALAEFLPVPDVEAMFARWDREAFGKPLQPGSPDQA